MSHIKLQFELELLKQEINHRAVISVTKFDRDFFKLEERMRKDQTDVSCLHRNEEKVA